MSHYAKISVEFQDAKLLVEALVAAGVKREHIELHAMPQLIFDYCDRRTNYISREHPGNKVFAQGDVGNVIIRRQHLGPSHNDIGFYCAKTGALALICDFARSSSGYNDKWLGKVTQEYTVSKTKAHYAALGKQVVRVDEDNKVRLYVKA